jgi:outer membrane protein assembly factor BamD (BamD/ComL family)
MSRSSLLLGAALAAAGVVGCFSAVLVPETAMAQDAPKPQKISAKVSKPLKAAQDAINTQNWDEALTQLAAAQAVEGKTPYDQYMTNELTWYTHLQKKDYAAAATVLEAQLASGQTPAADLTLRTKTLTQLNYQVQNYPKAIEFGNRYLALAPTDKEMGLLVAQSYALVKDYAGARDLVNRLSASGVPDEQLLRIGLRSSFELKDRPATVAALEQLVRYYPKPEYWTDLLNNTLFQTKEDRELRHLYRLMDDVGALKDGDNCAEAGTVLNAGGFPSEAERLLSRCAAANLYQGDVKARATASLDAARRGAEADRKDVATAAAALAAAKTGNEMVAFGKLYFSTGDYAKAADALSKGLAKGGVTDVADAQMLLGIAQKRAGDAASALTTFKSVADPKLATIAKFWALHVEPRQAAVAPVAAPAPAPTGSGG